MAKKTRSSRILQEIRETARGLQKVGLIDDQRMAEFDVLYRSSETDTPQPANPRDPSNSGGHFVKLPTVAKPFGILRNGAGLSHFLACNILRFFR